MQGMCMLYACVLQHSERAMIFKKGKGLACLCISLWSSGTVILFWVFSDSSFNDTEPT